MYIIKTLAKAKDRIIEEAIMYVKNETIAKKFCDEYNRYNSLINNDTDYYEEAIYYKIIPSEYVELSFSTYIRVIIKIEDNRIYITFEVSHNEFNKYPYCEEKLYKECSNIFWFYLRTKSEENLHALKSRCVNKAIELIKKEKDLNVIIDNYPIVVK